MIRLIYIIFTSILVLLLQSCMVSEKRVHTEFFNTKEFKNNSKFVSINVPTFLAKKFVVKAIDDDTEGKEIANLVRKISDVKVLIVESTKTDVASDFKKFLAKNKYNEWMSIKQDNQFVSINAIESGDLIRRLIIAVSDDEESIYLDVKGKFTIEDLSKLINATQENKIKFKKNKENKKTS